MKWGLVAVAMAACVEPGSFLCDVDPQCGPDGRCEPTGFCSFPDPACGRRYGEHAPDGLRNQCVGAADAAPGGPDAAPGPDGAGGPDASAATCTSDCPGTCQGDLCVIVCDIFDPCPLGVTCPPGHDCRIDCVESGTCPGIDCDQARSCVVRCLAFGACSGPITCAGESCSVLCQDESTCDGDIDCGAADCAIECLGTDSCRGDLFCGPGRCSIGCLGVDSCMGGLDCQNACACETDCSGGGCGIVHCPATCEVATDTCSTLPGGCDSC